MPLKTEPFEFDRYLKNASTQRALLRDAIATGDAGYIADALGMIARARGIKDIAGATGVTKAGLYKGLSKDGDPKLSTFLGVLKAIGFELSVKKAA